MPVPETTSAEAFERYVGGKCLRTSRGKVWKEIKAWIIEPQRHGSVVSLPAVSEPFLAWTFSGDVEFQEREGDGPWITHGIKKGSFFLTSGGGPYECRWKARTPEPFLSMHVSVELPLLERAFEEVHGKNAVNARLKNVSAFTDSTLNWLMEKVHSELLSRRASAMLVQGLGQAIAIHLARHYTEIVHDARTPSPSLPGFKLQQITDWMATHIADEFNLEQLAAKAGLSKFHFIRLFKSATGVPPSHYHQNLRMTEAKRLLRETKQSVIEIALEVGYANPSHFARLFRRETGFPPSDYRRQR
jgi:AraC family transcriptional regulator